MALTTLADTSAWGGLPQQPQCSTSASEVFSSASASPGGHLSVRLSHLGLDAHAELLERCAAENLGVPEAAMVAWGSALELSLARQMHQEQQEDQEQEHQQGPASHVAHSVVRLLVAFSRVGRRPPHQTMNALLAAMQPHLMGLPERRLAACLGALSRLR